MKNFVKIIFAALAIGIISSCEKVDNSLQSEEGVTVAVSNETGFIDVDDIAGSSFSAEISRVGNIGVNSVDIFKSFDGVTVKHSTLNQLPGTLTATSTEIADGLGISASDFEAGDKVELSFKLATDDGRTLEAGTKAIIPVTCGSDIGGMYDAVATGQSTDGCCPDPTTTMAVIELVDNGSGRYTIQDFSGGLYFEWYDVYGIGSINDSPGDLEEVCGVIKFVTGGTGPFGGTVNGSGSLDATTGVITYDWNNSFGDTGSVTLTPQ